MKLINPKRLLIDLYYYLKLKYTKQYYTGTNLLTLSLAFERDADGRWYVKLPDWKGSRSALEMVAGADTLLTLLSQGKSEITLNVSNDWEVYEIWSRRQLTYTATAISNQGDYRINVFNMNIWLCSVLVFVFRFYPNEIYFTIKY